MYAPTLQANPAPAMPTISAAMVVNFFIGLSVFLGGFVLFEPAPYELLLAALLVVGVLFGLKIPSGIVPLLVAVSLLSFGGLMSSFLLVDYSRGIIFTTVTFFLGLTAVFFAILIGRDMDRLRLIFRLYVLAAIVSTIPGLLGYFGIPGFEIFTRYGRSQGVFADPNVYSPFLVAPALYLMYGTLKRSLTLAPVRLGMLLLILLGLFLAFSRAGWGLMVLSAAMFYFLLFVTERSGRMKARYLLFGFSGLVAIGAALGVALQIEAIASVFSERAQVVQSYDGARFGRFARHWIGFEMALTRPLGLGVSEFGLIYGEDEHNVYLKSLLAYGWLGFVSWMAMVVMTLCLGFKLLFRQRPWLPYLQIAYVTFFGHLLVGWVIDIDRWRHFYLMIGVIWGCVLLERQWQKRRARLNRRQAAGIHGPETASA